MTIVAPASTPPVSPVHAATDGCRREQGRETLRVERRRDRERDGDARDAFRNALGDVRQALGVGVGALAAAGQQRDPHRTRPRVPVVDGEQVDDDVARRLGGSPRARNAAAVAASRTKTRRAPVTMRRSISPYGATYALFAVPTKTSARGRDARECGRIGIADRDDQRVASPRRTSRIAPASRTAPASRREDRARTRAHCPSRRGRRSASLAAARRRESPPRRMLADQRQVFGRDRCERAHVARDAGGDRRFAVPVRNEQHGRTPSAKQARSRAMRVRPLSRTSSVRDTNAPYGPTWTIGTPLHTSGSASVSCE